MTATHFPPAPEHFWQVPPQSLSLQQALLSMHALPHGLKPEAHPETVHLLDDVSHCRAIPLCAGQSLFEQQPSLGMHFDPHFFCEPQLKLHCLPSQVAVPPEGAWQGSQEPPHVSTDELETQLPTHRCCCPVHVGPCDEPAAPCDEPAAPCDEPAAPCDEPAAPCDEPALPDVEPAAP
jgi:hypothetical protein